MKSTTGIAIQIAVFVVFMTIQTGDALKCFRCNSYHDISCADWFDNVTHHLQPCDADENICRKIVQEVYFDGEWDVRYIRDCAKRGEIGAREGRDCKERVGTYNVKLRYCHCNNQDGCNTGHTFHSSYQTLCIMSILAVLTYNLLSKTTS